MPRAMIAGGRGFLGQGLVRHLRRQSWDVDVLTRRPEREEEGYRELEWDGRSVGPWAHRLDATDVVVNVTGKTIDCRFTPANRAAIVNSRVWSVEAIGQAIRRTSSPPALWIQASAVGIYGDAKDRICTEETAPGDGFVAEVCQTWERTLDQEGLSATRKVILRVGPVLGKEGGALPRLVRLSRRGLGGTVGHGCQWLSWLHQEDFNRIVAWNLRRPSASGVYNATAPNPSPNRDFMSQLRAALGVRFAPPVPSFAIRLGAPLMGLDASLVLTGQRCHPARLIGEGFEFSHATLDEALRNLL